MAGTPLDTLPASSVPRGTLSEIRRGRHAAPREEHSTICCSSIKRLRKRDTARKGKKNNHPIPLFVTEVKEKTDYF